MKKIILAAGVIALGVFFAFGYVLYKVGEEIHTYRCGAAGQRFHITEKRG